MNLIPWNHWSLAVCSFSYKCFSFSICVLSFNCFTLFNIALFWSLVNHYLQWGLALKQTVPQIYLASLCDDLVLDRKTISYSFRFIVRVNFIAFKNYSQGKKKKHTCLFMPPAGIKRQVSRSCLLSRWEARLVLLFHPDLCLFSFWKRA